MPVVKSKIELFTKFIVKLLPQVNQSSKHQSIKIRMSYLTPFILLYIIDQHKPKPLDNPEKNLIIFLLRFSLKSGRGAFLPSPPKGVVLGMQWLLTLAYWLQFPYGR